MLENSTQKNKQNMKAAPYAFVNSTIAMMLVVAGFLTHNILTLGGLSQSSAISISFTAVNLCVFYMWSRFNARNWLFGGLFIMMVLQWGYVLFQISNFYFNSSVAVAAVLVVLVVSIWKVLIQEGNKWSGALLFSMLGTAAMGGTIWHGLEDWTLSAAARARPLPVPENFQSGLLTAKSFIATNFITKTAKVAQPALPATWSYQGETGPEMWGALRDDFKLCASGLNQSPVDIPKHTKFLRGGLRPNWRPEKVSLIKTGHALEVNLSGKSKTDIGGNQYELKQIQFHTPSEHQLSGFSYPMEIHFIHARKDGSQSIVAAFVEIGSENPEFLKISSRASALNESVSVDLGELNASLLLPKSTDVFRYQGSITSPPCSEGVVWNVLREPIEFSQEQVSSFRRLFPTNARPLQKLDARSFDTTESKIAH